MVNLIVDITNMFYRAMFSTSNYGKDSYTYDSKFECDQLVRKFCTDMAVTIRQVRPNRVFFCRDKSPWRKNIHIEENEGYKLNRTKSQVINWDNIYKSQNDIFKILSEKGLCVCDIDSAEADDIMAMLVDELYGIRNESCILLSSDEDIRQKIQSKYVDDKHIFVCALNPIKQGGKNASKKIYHDGKLEEWVNSQDNVSAFDIMFSNTTDSYKANMRQLVNDTQFEKVVVDGDMIALKKLLMGDDGDNIPAFYTWNKKTKAGKDTKDRITNKKFEKILETLQINSIKEIDTSKLIALKSCIESFAKAEMTVDIFERFNRQKQLVELDPSNFPEHIVSLFELNKEKWLNVIPKLHLFNLSMQDILKDTEYINTEYEKYNIENTNMSSIYKDIEKMKKISNRNSLI